MFRKVVFLVFRNNYRSSALGNFGKSNFYENIILISLGGRFKYILGKILYYFKIGKFISIDGDPIFINQNNSINLWLTGTSLKILREYRNLNNNFVNMSNPILSEEKKIFQIYPIIKKVSIINKEPKIIFMGKIFFQPNNQNSINYDFLSSNKEKLLNNFSIIDNKNFWQEINNKKNENQKFEDYKIIKTFLRELIINEINKNFKKKFILYGEDKKKIGINFKEPTFALSKIKQIYQGNLCIDTGSILGSLSLHPRSIQIIESGGLLIQSKQNDSEFMWEGINEKIIFNNINSLIENLEKYLTNPKECNDILEMLFKKFLDTKKKINKDLEKILFN